MANRRFTAIVQREGAVWVSLCPELDVASQGDTADTASDNLREAVELFLATAAPAEVANQLRTETVLTQFEVTLG